VIPRDSAGGCQNGGGPVFFGEEGSVVLNGGWICGLLVVEGDLLLAEGARFQGLALVGGNLVLEGEAELEGMVRVRGGIRVAPGSEFRTRSCPVLWALEGLPDLREPFILPHAQNLNGY